MEMSPFTRFAQELLARNEPAMLVRLDEVKGSAPRETGTVMLVTADQCSGTIGGGHLEWDAIAKARRLIAQKKLDHQRLHVALGPALGQCCGGALDLVFEPLSIEALGVLEAVSKPLFRLNLFGAGHVGRALVTVLSTLRCDVTWIDEREEEFPSLLPPRVRKVAVDAPEAEVAYAQAGDFYLVLTHRHDLDELIVRDILKRGDAGFIGLIGSQTKRARFTSRLKQAGLSMEQVVCPVGVALGDDASRKEPGQIAIAMAQVLLTRSHELHQAVKPDQGQRSREYS